MNKNKIENSKANTILTENPEYHFLIYKFDKMDYDSKNICEILNKNDIEEYKGVIQSKLESIENCEFFFLNNLVQLEKVIVYGEKYIPEEEITSGDDIINGIEFLINRYFTNILINLNSALSTAFELPDINFLKSKIDLYKKQFESVFEKLTLFLIVSKRDTKHIEKLHNYYKILIDFWTTVRYYISNQINLLHPNWTLANTFDFDLVKIDNFINVIKKDDLDGYETYLKEMLLLSNNNNLNYIENEAKLEKLFELHKKQKKEILVYSLENIYHSIFKVLKGMGLSNDYEDFTKIINKRKGLLKFNNEPLVPKVFQYHIGRIFEQIINKRYLQLTKDSLINFQFNDKAMLITLSKLLLNVDTALTNSNEVQKKIQGKSESGKQLIYEEYISKNKFYKEWIKEMNSLVIFRNTISF